MIKIDNLSKTYSSGDQPVRAVHNALLTINAGEFASIVGHSGSGKSSLLAMVGGILRPDAGTVTIDGTDIWSLQDSTLSHFRNSTFGFIYQFPSLIPTLTAEENVLLPTVFGGTADRVDAERLLELVGLGDKVGRYPSELSGGEQQRVAIARAFINQPAILLADEPTGNLDEETEADIIAVIERLNRDKRTTIIMVTHNTDLAAHASRTFRMKGGIISETA